MLSEIADFEDGHQFDADVAIVGGGPAGIALAMHMSKGRQKVLLLEAGGLSFDAQAQSGSTGSQSGLPYFALDTSRYRMLGGSTFRWGARSAPLKAHDFVEREWVPHSGWPISLDALDQYYDQAYDLIDLHRPFAFDEGVWKQMKVQSPAFDLARFDVNAFQFGRNLLFGTVYRDALRRSESVRVLLGANVLEVLATSNGAHVEGLDVGHVSGRRYRVRARHYVLAAGGIDNARLLLLSTGANPAGLANGNDVVGRYFMEHPTVSAGTLTTDKPNPLIDAFSPGLTEGRLVEVGLSLKPDEQRATGSLNAVARATVLAGDDATQALRELYRNFRHRRLPHDLNWYQKNAWLTRRLATIASDPFSIMANSVRHLTGRPNRFKIDSISLELRTEQAPNRDSRVTLANEVDTFGKRRAHLHWALLPQDKHTMQVLARTVAAELDRLKIGKLEMADWLVADDASFGTDLVGGHHHMGTTRMSADPRTGTVDTNSRAHEVNNLYIAGASVFPTAGFVNPTATLIALARRLGDHLQTFG